MKQTFSLLIFLLIYQIATAQNEVSKSKVKNEEGKEKNLEFVPVPYVNYNRTTEFEYGLMPMFMYRFNPEDTISPKSISGGLAVNTTNNTTFGLIFSRLYFKEDKYRATFAAGIGDYNAQVFISNVFLPTKFYDFTTEFQLLNLGLQRRVWNNLFLGLGYLHIETDSYLTEFDGFVSSHERTGVFFTANNDNRDNVYFPRKGSLTEMKLFSFLDWLGNDESSVVLNIAWNNYRQVRRKKDVLASRISAESVFGDVSFEQQTIVGGREIRGYPQGKYRGEQIVNLQSEYRWMPLEKVGFVGFASISKLFGSNIEEHNKYWYPAVGAGFRYLVLEQNQMRVGLDYAVGKEDWGVYFKIGESF